MASKGKVDSPDFSQPSDQSDVVLVVEEERFSVNRDRLAAASPVFEKMLTSKLQGKDANEVPLPGKKASEIKELLAFLRIYPSVNRRTTEENRYFLVKLAHEYQMETIVTACDKIMADIVKAKPKDSVVADLVFAQTYKLEKLILASVNQAQSLSLEELKSDEKYDQIQPDNLKEIMEGIIKRLQRELNEAQQLAQERQTTIDSAIAVLSMLHKKSL
ncbi:BTB and MATH domain-containing protein 38-like [Oculina patagonica]